MFRAVRSTFVRILDVLPPGETDQSLLKDIQALCPFLSELEIVLKPSDEIVDLASFMNDEGFSGGALSLDYSAEIQQLFPRRPASVQEIEAFDFIEWSPDGHLWPLYLLGNYLKSNLVKQIHHLDLTGVGYVIGTQKISSCAVITLIKLGLKKIRWVIGDDDYVPVDFEKIQKKFFGIQIEMMSSSKLSLQNVDGSILLSTMDYRSRPEILQDICYFNFIKQDSFVCDLYLPTKVLDFQSSPLIREAQEAGLPAFKTAPVAADIYLDFLSRFRLFSAEDQRDFLKIFAET